MTADHSDLVGRARAILADLVAFDTTSEKSNLGLIDYVADLLSESGISHRRVHDETQRKANLFATVGPNVAGGIVLSGHTDVVPVEDQAWTSDPFTLTERRGRFFGRGTCDMKGFLALALAAVPDMVRANPSVPIHLAFSYDEEIGCIGVRPMIDAIIRDLPRPRAVIVGEPTSMKVVNAHKGSRRFVTRVTGYAAHSSQSHKGANAIAAAAKLIGFLEDEQAKRTASAPPPESMRFTPPYTTIEVGTIDGGTAANIIPRSCRFEWEYRMLPDESPETIIEAFRAYAEDHVLPPLQERHADCAIDTKELAFAPPFRTNPESDAESLAFMLAGTNETEAVSFATEAGLFEAADIPTV
ncbi:MAG: acetylornithine deacetylase, partial [Pseudomonadota bacterium]